nr:MAG TPA: hypothetical protein [Caudoviricetes sp.]
MKNNGRRVRIAIGELIARFLRCTDFNLPLRSVFFLFSNSLVSLLVYT